MNKCDYCGEPATRRRWDEAAGEYECLCYHCARDVYYCERKGNVEQGP